MRPRKTVSSRGLCHQYPCIMRCTLMKLDYEDRRRCVDAPSDPVAGVEIIGSLRPGGVARNISDKLCHVTSHYILGYMLSFRGRVPGAMLKGSDFGLVRTDLPFIQLILSCAGHGRRQENWARSTSCIRAYSRDSLFAPRSQSRPPRLRNGGTKVRDWAKGKDLSRAEPLGGARCANLGAGTQMSSASHLLIQRTV